ncbi:MAG: Gfo/Idh/MocA family oxidoreductase [Kiritimatiellia bacterium]
MTFDMNRRNFLKSALAVGATGMVSGCKMPCCFGGVTGAPMHGFAAPAIPNIRLGIVGMGGRGQGVMGRIKGLPGITVVAICDKNHDKIARSQKWLANNGKPKAKEYLGEQAWRALCDDPEIDVVYNTTPWELHVPVELAAMNGGKHVFTEVPSAFTVDECWELVETSERTKRHCMQLENCCYGEIEMLTFNLAKLGMLGDIIHAEGAYIHDLRDMCRANYPDYEYWRYPHNRDHAGNRYATHGLVPLCLTMDVNRGDRLDYLVSMDSRELNFALYKKNHLKPGDPRLGEKMKTGDMNTSLIRTVQGKTMVIQHDVSSPRPYSRIQLVSGTKGIIKDYPYQIVFEEKNGAGAHAWYPPAQADEIAQKYKHPLYKTIGELAKRVGGHGGMDFIMDARWIYCLQQGLPLDMDVYDLAVTCCVGELTEKSALRRSAAIDIPDYTRGAWKTHPPMEVVDIDLVKFGLKDDQIQKADGQMSV